MPNLRYFFYLILIGFLTPVVHGQIYDNRYMPLYAHTKNRTSSKKSSFMVDIFGMVGHQAFINSETSGGIPEIFGVYDQSAVAKAMVAIGLPNPLIPAFTPIAGKPIPWTMKGKLQTQGISFEYNQCVYNRSCGSFAHNLSFGASWFFMHLFSHIGFNLSEQVRNALNLDEEQVLLLDAIRRSMNQQTGILAPTSGQAGFSDIDCYMRWGGLWDYVLKMRHIDAGISCGLLINSGVTRDPNNPASIPFGGDGFFGVYLAADAQFEIREDWKVGGLLRFSNRFSKTKQERISVAREQPLFGVTRGPVKIAPGPTFVLAPYFSVEDIRDGLGVQVNYTLVYHLDDLWIDKRNNQQPTANLGAMDDFSSWTSEYLTFNLYYDFAKVRTELRDAPTCWFMWDFPIRLAVAERVSKTHRISLGMIFNF